MGLLVGDLVLGIEFVDEGYRGWYKIDQKNALKRARQPLGILFQFADTFTKYIAWQKAT